MEKFIEKLKIGEDMTESEKVQLKELIIKYEDIMEYNEKKKANIKRFEHKLIIKESIEPIKQAPYRETEEKKEIMRKEIDEMLE